MGQVGDFSVDDAGAGGDEGVVAHSGALDGKHPVERTLDEIDPTVTRVHEPVSEQDGMEDAVSRTA